MILLKRGRSQVYRPRNHQGLGLHVELMAKINDEHGLASGQLRLELLGADARDTQLAEKELAARHLDALVEPEDAGNYRDGPGAHAVGEDGSLGKLIVKSVAQTDI
jgi:hypothetical protein